MTAHTFNPNTEEAEAARPLWVPRQSDLHTEFKS